MSDIENEVRSMLAAHDRRLNELLGMVRKQDERIAALEAQQTAPEPEYKPGWVSNDGNSIQSGAGCCGEDFCYYFSHHAYHDTAVLTQYGDSNEFTADQLRELIGAAMEVRALMEAGGFNE